MLSKKLLVLWLMSPRLRVLLKILSKEAVDHFVDGAVMTCPVWLVLCLKLAVFLWTLIRQTLFRFWWKVLIEFLLEVMDHMLHFVHALVLFPTADNGNHTSQCSAIRARAPEKHGAASRQS